MKKFSLPAYRNPIPTDRIRDYPPIGDGRGYNGLELLLMSFAGCSGTTIVYLLRKMGKSVTGLKMNARSVRWDQPPLKFEKIFHQFLLESADVEVSDIRKALHLAEDSTCPVWQMVKNNAGIAAEYSIAAE
jgi:putative redox protein